MGNPFSNPFGGVNPLAGGLPNESHDDGNSFNVDDLVKRIDAKIAELEEEERKEKEASSSNVDKVIDEEVVKEESSMYEDGTNSDEFFDDFFSDD